MTQPGTPTAETWNKQAIPTACWGHATAAPATADKPGKISRTKLDLAQKRIQALESRRGELKILDPSTQRPVSGQTPSSISQIESCK
ncbi:hypothetical protein QUA79_09300 [Microcoleus sp. F8-D1]